MLLVQASSRVALIGQNLPGGQLLCAANASRYSNSIHTMYSEIHTNERVAIAETVYKESRI